MLKYILLVNILSIFFSKRIRNSQFFLDLSLDFVYINLLNYGKKYENGASEIYDIHILSQIKDYDRRQFCFIELPETKNKEITLVIINQIEDSNRVYNISTPFTIQVEENCPYSILINKILTNQLEFINASKLEVWFRKSNFEFKLFYTVKPLNMNSLFCENLII